VLIVSVRAEREDDDGEEEEAEEASRMFWRQKVSFYLRPLMPIQIEPIWFW
jgi:hypothetical protein